MTPVVVRVGELVVEGATPAEARSIESAFRAELTRLATDGDAPPARQTHVLEIDRPAGGPHAAGVSLARAIWRGR